MTLTISYPEGNGGSYEQFRYPAGEVQVRLFPPTIEAVRKADNIHIIAHIQDGEIMGLAQLINAIENVNYPSFNKYTPITLILPYLPYGRADRPFTSGDCFGLRTFANLINSMGLEKVVTLDAHSDVSEMNVVSLVDVSPGPIIQTVLEDLHYPIILLPDKGAARYKLNGLECSKVRDPKTGKLSGFLVPDKTQFGLSKSALIIDDICDGGGTFIGLAKALEGYNLDLYLYVTHGIFSRGFDELLKYFKHIYTTDSFYKFNPSYKMGFTEPKEVTVIPTGGVILDKILSRSELWKNGEKSA